MRLMTASSLTRLAGPNPTGIRLLFATMARVANKEADKWARASYVEGLLGYSPGTLLGSNLAPFNEAALALESGEPNRVTEHLLYERSMSEKDARALLGDRDRDLMGALLAGIKSKMPSAVRGLTPEGVAQAIAMGISPSTLERFPSYKGGNVFHHLGATNKGGVTLGGLTSVLRKHGANAAIDVVRRKELQDGGSLSLSDPALAPVGLSNMDGPEAVLEDILAGDSAVTRADYIEMAESIFKNPAIMRVLDKEVRSYLGGPAQIAVWDVMRNNPQFIAVKGSPQGEPVVGLGDGAGAAREFEKLTGTEVSKQRIGQIWSRKVWPAMREAFRDSNVARTLLRSRQVMEVIDDETRRRHNVEPKMRGIREQGDFEPFGGDGPGRSLSPDSGNYDEWGSPEGRSDFYEKEMARMRSKYRVPAGVKFASSRVALRYAKANNLPRSVLSTLEEGHEKTAWSLPPREAKAYNQLRKWALANWEQFLNPYGDLDTDDMAEAMARRAGNDDWADDPAHWVYEIAYDVNRLLPSLRY